MKQYNITYHNKTTFLQSLKSDTWDLLQKFQLLELFYLYAFLKEEFT